MPKTAGDIVVDYRGPTFLRSTFEAMNLNLFDRVTKIRIPSDTSPQQIDTRKFPSLEEIVFDNLATASPDKAIKQRLRVLKKDRDERTEEILSTYSKCQLTFAKPKGSFETRVNIAPSFSCSQ